MTTMHENDLQATEGARGEPVRSPLKIDLAGVKKKSELKAAANDPEFIRKSRLAFSESFGAAAWLLSHDPVYRDASLRVLETAVGTALRLGQYKIYRKEGVPFAYASWAYLSPEIADRVISGGMGLRPSEWQSGNELWVVDLKAPFGGEEVVREDIQSRVFKKTALRNLGASRLADMTDPTIQDPMEDLFSELDAKRPDGEIRIVRADEALRKRYIGLAAPFIKMFLMAGAFKGLGLDAGKIKGIVGRLIERSDAVLLVALHRGIPCGGFAGEMHEFGFGRDRFAQELAFIVHPRFRNKGVGAKLLAEFEVWAREQGAVWLQYVQASGLEPEAAENAYLRSGAQRAGYVYRKPLRQVRQS